MTTRLCCLALVACLAACHAKKPTLPSSMARLKVHLVTSADSNGARPVYFALRSAADDSAFSEGYAAALTHTLRDPSTSGVLAQGLLPPSHTQVATVTFPKEQRLLLYVFFTDQNEGWKREVKRLPKQSIRLTVGDHDVVQEERKK